MTNASQSQNDKAHECNMYFIISFCPVHRNQNKLTDQKSNSSPPCHDNNYIIKSKFVRKSHRVSLRCIFFTSDNLAIVKVRFRKCVCLGFCRSTPAIGRNLVLSISGRYQLLYYNSVAGNSRSYLVQPNNMQSHSSVRRLQGGVASGIIQYDVCRNDYNMCVEPPVSGLV